MIEDIKKIILDGSRAPSGENCQPWKFIVEGNKINIFNIPEADQSLYNFQQKGSYVAHGALIENISISAAQHGYATQVQVFPKTSDINLVATITFEKLNTKVVNNSVKNASLYAAISDRCTNRKEHTVQKLTIEEKKALVTAAEDSGYGRLTIIDDPSILAELGRSLAINEEIIFENRKLHDFFYNHILWNKEDENKAGGFYIKTLEFLPHQLKGVKLFKNWTILSILNKIGKISKKIAKENAQKYAASGALAAVVIDGKDNASFVKAGRTVERVWLTATQLGLSVHPCTGILYFNERLQGGDTESFSPEHTQLINEAYADISKVFSAQGKTIPMLFRIGHAEPPTARAHRSIPDILVR